MPEKYFADIVIKKEKLSDDSNVFVAHCTNLGIASQGTTTEEAIKNIKEAIELYLEEQPEKYSELNISTEPSLFSVIEISQNAKIANSLRQGTDKSIG
ncbi:MAG: type II toxin-antitoxin system HicB family antitoxin [Nanoarchaeota archaeon]|nr:type II toxin-antitoxin system HicB family antitoxin [Nanoarchaeota archaeon]MBU1103825.1 type II toxin-antitoxin system HicB family antitoxin [Nanoarchaeota archaeon]